MAKKLSDWEFRKLIDNKSILVIDDFSDMRNMLVNIMRSLGAKDIDSSVNGEKAIEAMEDKRYDIVLCDYNLGTGKDGQQVLEEARHRSLINMTTIFVMVTAESSRIMVMGAIEHEPDSYISKPFSKDLIKARIDRALAKKKDLGDVYKAVESHELDKAIAILDKKIAEKPKNLGELMRVKADLCFKAEKYECSKEIYAEILANRDVAWAQMGKGKVLYKQKKYAEAAEIFRDLVKVNPDFTNAMDWQARCYKAMGQLEEAKAILNNALEVSPRGILRQEMYGDLNLQTGDYANAEKAFTQAAKLGRNSVHNHPSIFANLAMSQTSQEKHGEALKSIEKIKKRFGEKQNADIYTAASEALVYHNQGDEEKSAEAMKKASALYEIAGDSADNQMTLEMAKVASSLGDMEMTENLLKKAVQNNHNDDEFLNAVTQVLHKSDLDLDPEDFVSDLRKGVIEMNNRGVKLLQAGKLDDAVALFEEAAEQMSTNVIITTNTVRALLTRMEKQGSNNADLFKVRQFLERLKRIDSNESTYQKLVIRLKKIVQTKG
ncbi:MAG: tetratricopeptide repeat protein [Gammaproteobacteria bacterium]|jgi:tetratricopeptide (TPR) repeat protein